MEKQRLLINTIAREEDRREGEKIFYDVNSRKDRKLSAKEKDQMVSDMVEIFVQKDRPPFDIPHQPEKRYKKPLYKLSIFKRDSYNIQNRRPMVTMTYHDQTGKRKNLRYTKTEFRSFMPKGWEKSFNNGEVLIWDYPDTQYLYDKKTRATIRKWCRDTFTRNAPLGENKHGTLPEAGHIYATRDNYGRGMLLIEDFESYIYEYIWRHGQGKKLQYELKNAASYYFEGWIKKNRQFKHGLSFDEHAEQHDKSMGEKTPARDTPDTLEPAFCLMLRDKETPYNDILDSDYRRSYYADIRPGHVWKNGDNKKVWEQVAAMFDIDLWTTPKNIFLETVDSYLNYYKIREGKNRLKLFRGGWETTLFSKWEDNLFDNWEKTLLKVCNLGTKQS